MEETMMNASKEVMDSEVIGDVTEASGETSDKGTIIALAIGAGLAVGTILVSKLVKKVIANIKAKKESAEADDDTTHAIETDFEDVSESQDEE